MRRGHRVDPDPARDHELDSQQSDPGRGELRQRKGVVGIRHVQQQWNRRTGCGGRVDLLPGELHRALVDPALVPLRARDGHHLAGGQRGSGPAGADDAGNPQLSRHDGGMAGAATLIGHYRRDPLEDRLPVRVGHAGDQDLAGLDLGELVRPVHQADRAGADALAHALARQQHAPGSLAAEQLEPGAGLGGVHRLRAGLDDEQLAALAVLGPFDVHRCGPAGRAGVVFLDRQGPAGQSDQLVVRQHEAAPVRVRHPHLPHRAQAPLRIDQFHRLGAALTPQNGAEPRAQGRLVQPELVRHHPSLYQALRNPPSAGDQHHVPEATLGIEREDHAGGAKVAPDHLLHPDRQRHLAVGEPLLAAVHDRPIREQRSEAGPDSDIQRGEAPDVEISLVLTRETGPRQVLRGRARTHGYIGGRLAIETRQLGIRFGHRRHQHGGQRGFSHPCPDRLAHLGQGAYVAEIERGEGPLDPLGQAGFAEVQAEGVGREDEPLRNPHALSAQGVQHLAERGILAAHPIEVGEGDARQRNNVGEGGVGHTGLNP